MDSIVVYSNFHLPMDLISEILSRLPVKPLLRFKTVCKTWYALIQNPNFIKTHHAKSNQNLTVLIYTAKINKFNYSLLLQYSSEEHCNLTTNPNFLFKYRPYAVGISEGLVCLSTIDSRYDTVVCNPSIGMLRKIPRFRLPNGYLDTVFMGFVLLDNDYKLFRIIYSRYSSEETFIRGEVYSMSSDTWNTIKVKNGEVDRGMNLGNRWCCDSHTGQVVINGIIFWEQCTEFALAIVAYFDINSYEFGVVQLPVDSDVRFWQIVKLKEELALLIRSSKWFELWVFNEKERFWMMKVRTGVVPLTRRGLCCLGCDINGKLLMLEFLPGKDHSKMFLYDPVTSKITYLTFSGTMDFVSNLFLYTESLLWYGEEKREYK